jgi:hypothetical protein
MLVLKINYTKHLDRAAKSVRYHAFRSRELPHDERGMFDRTSDHADVGRFIASLDDPLTRDWQTRKGTVIQPPKLHRLMFSLSRREFEASGLTSWKPVIREALESVERYHGIKLDWVAAEHQSLTHPHVHVDIKSVYTAADGTRHRLVIKDELRLHLRLAVEGIIKRERTRVNEDRRQERAFDRAVHDITLTFLRGLRDATRDDGNDANLLPRRKPKRRQLDDRDDRDR